MTKKLSVAFHIYPDALFSFSKFYFYGLLGGGRGAGGRGVERAKKCPKRQKFLSHLIFRNCTSYDCGFWCTCPAIISTCTHLSPSIFFHSFQNFDFLGFSKFISKWQKETLRWAPLSSHLWSHMWFYFFIKYSGF